MRPDRPLKKAPRKRAAEGDASADPPSDEGVEPREEATAPPRDKGIKPRANAPVPRTRPATIEGVLRRWLDAPEPVLRLELIRILAPLATLGFMSSRLAHADEWLSDVGFQVPRMAVSDYRQPFYLSPLSPTAAWALAALMVTSGLAVAAGFRARAAAVVFAGTLAYVALADRLAAFTVSKLAPTVMIALALSPCGVRFGVDAWRRKQRAPDAPLPAYVAGGGPRFFQILMPLFYLGSAMAKINGDWLTHRLVLWTHVHDSYQTGFSWLLARAMPAWGWTLLQYVVLALEAGAPLWFGLRRTRPWALLLAVGMHAMIGLMFWPVRWFSLLMITLWLGAFLPEAWLEKLEARSPRM
jgi:uncharacterized membrane protein YphA (DoxX/SURF4 family)